MFQITTPAPESFVFGRCAEEICAVATTAYTQGFARSVYRIFFNCLVLNSDEMLSKIMKSHAIAREKPCETPLVCGCGGVLACICVCGHRGSTFGDSSDIMRCVCCGKIAILYQCSVLRRLIWCFAFLFRSFNWRWCSCVCAMCWRKTW